MPTAAPETPPPARSVRSDRLRLIVLVLLLLSLPVLDALFRPALTTIYRVEQTGSPHPDQSLGSADTDWPNEWFEHRTALFQPPAPSAGVRRILYLSNSHALTGGKVSRHLQAMLDEVAPGQFELIDLSVGGVFAPEMHQRLAAGLDLQPDAVILGFSYIGFSDRMGLARQRHTARQFLRPDVAGRLDSGFWLRNYDIGLFSNEAVAGLLDLYRFRAQGRVALEYPWRRLLRDLDGGRLPMSLHVNIDNTWQFPEGYDRNLFQWRLYRVGRKSHLAELRQMVGLAREHGLPVFAQNMPIDWNKGSNTPDPVDARRYRQQLSAALRETDGYLDWQDVIPTRLTTYDPLHPNRYGARLHAYASLLQLHDQGYLPVSIGEPALAEAFRSTATDTATIDIGLIQAASPQQLRKFQRMDISDDEVVRSLLARLKAYPADSPLYFDTSYRLAAHLDYFSRQLTMPFGMADARLDAAMRFELAQMRERLASVRAAFKATLIRSFSAFTLDDRAAPRIIAKPRPDSSYPHILQIQRDDGLKFYVSDLLLDRSYLSVIPSGHRILQPPGKLPLSKLMSIMD